MAAGSRERKLMVQDWNLNEKPRSGDSNETRVEMGSFSKLTYHVVFLPSTAERRLLTIVENVFTNTLEALYEK